MIFEGFIHVQGVQVFGIKTGEQHIHHDGDIDFAFARIIPVGVLLVFDALLHILIVQIKFIDAVVGTELGVVIGDHFLKRGRFLSGLFPVIRFFLWQIFLYLPHVFVALGGRREDAGNIQGRIVLVFSPLFCLHPFEQPVVFDGLVDRCRCQKRVEAALVGGGIVLLENLGDNRFR